jgi:hypothetical protein
LNLRRWAICVGALALPLTGLTVSASGTAEAATIGTGTYGCGVFGTVTFNKPVSTEQIKGRVTGKLTVTSSDCSPFSTGISVTKGTGKFVLKGTDNSPCFMYGGGFGAALSLTLRYPHLKSSVFKGFIGGVQSGGAASSLNGEGTVTGSYPSSAATLSGLMNDGACNTGITSTSFSLYLTNF